MGTSYSQEDIERFALEMYNDILWQTPCLLPDVGIDESLLKYSGDDSNAVLQSYSDGMLDSMPGYVSGFGSAFGNLKSVPNAVGLGALVISMIIEIIIKSSTQTSDKTDTYSLLRRVFGEEKASSVRDIMTEYLKRHRMFMTNDQLLREDIKRLEKQLSQHLTILRNSLLQDGQMSSRGLKIWVNGAAFHVQMLIHEVRLGVKADKTVSDCVFVINAAIDVYSQSLDLLLEKYKPYKINSNMWKYPPNWRKALVPQVGSEQGQPKLLAPTVHQVPPVRAQTDPHVTFPRALDRLVRRPQSRPHCLCMKPRGHSSLPHHGGPSSDLGACAPAYHHIIPQQKIPALSGGG
ncbi:hypothetical protein F2P79_020858 [Pimephales promelas]|nr:hypothetical protein F2P79_020858 [Pimephales promelas]